MKATNQPGGHVNEDGMRHGPSHGPEKHGLFGHVFESVQLQPRRMRALDPDAHGMQLLDTEGALCQACCELLIRRGACKGFGAKAVYDDEAAVWGEERGHLVHEVSQAFDAADVVD